MAGATRSGTRLRVALFLAVGLAMTGLGLLAYGTNVFRDLDLRSVDTRFTIRGNQGAPKDIVVVKIDDRDLQRPAATLAASGAGCTRKLIDELEEDGREGDRLRRPVHRADGSRGRQQR